MYRVDFKSCILDKLFGLSNYVIWNDYICTTSENNYVSIWTNTGKYIIKLFHDSHVSCLKTWDNRLCCGTFSGTISVWNEDMSCNMILISSCYGSIKDIKTYKDFLFGVIEYDDRKTIYKWNRSGECIRSYSMNLLMNRSIHFGLIDFEIWDGRMCEFICHEIKITNEGNKIVKLYKDFDACIPTCYQCTHFEFEDGMFNAYKDPDCKSESHKFTRCMTIWNDHLVVNTTRGIKCVSRNGDIETLTDDNASLYDFIVYHNDLFGIYKNARVKVWNWQTKRCIQTFTIIENIASGKIIIREKMLYINNSLSIFLYDINKIEWNTLNHRLFSYEIKKFVLEMLMMAGKDSDGNPYHPDSLLCILPKDVLIIIISYCIS